MLTLVGSDVVPRLLQTCKPYSESRQVILGPPIVQCQGTIETTRSIWRSSLACPALRTRLPGASPGVFEGSAVDISSPHQPTSIPGPSRAVRQLINPDEEHPVVLQLGGSDPAPR